MQDKTTWLKTAAELGLKMNVPKTEIMLINNQSMSSTTLKGHILEEVIKFAYLGSVIAVGGGSQEDVKARKGKANTAFNILAKIWGKKNPQKTSLSRPSPKSSIPASDLYYCTDPKHGRTPIPS